MTISCVVEYVRERLEATQYQWMLFKEGANGHVTGLCKGSQRVTDLGFCYYILLIFVNLPSYGIKRIGKIIALTFQKEGVAHFSGLVVYRT